MDPVNSDGLTEAEFLAQYDAGNWPHPSLTADIALFRIPEDNPGESIADSLNSFSRKLELLLIKRGDHPFMHRWALPGGFVDPDETVDETARRELHEETGVTGLPLEQLGTYSKIGRDPRGWTVTGAYVSLVEEDVEVLAGDDAADARWFHVDVKRVDGNLRLTATCDEATLTCTFNPVERRFGPPRAQVISSEGFAFDHEQIVTDAYLAVTYRG